MNDKWDNRFMRIAKEISTWSKDPSSKIGAVIVDDNRRILATGYNGFPANINDDGRLHNREEKYPLIIHAEMNTLLNALKNGVPVDGASIYVYGLPVCGECAKAITQSGIKNVIVTQPDPNSKWMETWVKKSKPLFEESGIKIYYIDDTN